MPAPSAPRAPRTVIETAEAVRSGRLKAAEALDECLAAIEAANPTLNAFVHIDAEAAHAAAAAVDAMVAGGRDPGPLAGVPIGVKDLEDCAGMPTSHGSLLYKGAPPVAADSVHLARLRAAGAVPVGKTAAPEFGIVAFTATRAWGVTRNPWNPERTPGGSSGGSASAVAAGMVPLCTASDGGGSTRIPASFCGLVGLKPSFGRIPHPGNQPSTTTVFGALVTTVADAARHLDVAAGPHDSDRASLPPSGVCYARAIESLDVAGLRAVWSVDLGYATVDPEVATIAEDAARALVAAADLRAMTTKVAVGNPVDLWLAAGVMDLYENLTPGMWPERREELEPFTAFSLQMCDELKAPQIARIWQRRQRLDDDLAAVFSRVDVLLTPTTAVPAFAAEGPMPFEINGTSVHPAMNAPFTMLGNMGWHPAISVPAGLTSAGLPVGLQIMCPRHADEVALRLARIFEQARPWPRVASSPPVASPSTPRP